MPEELKDTHPEVLIESTSDSYYAGGFAFESKIYDNKQLFMTHPQKGRNNCGKLLMKVRGEIIERDALPGAGAQNEAPPQIEVIRIQNGGEDEAGEQ